MRNKRPGYDPGTFTSAMSRAEKLAVLLWLPIHVWFLPKLLYSLPQLRQFSEADMNLMVYAGGAIFMLLAAGRFFRRDFDPLMDHLPFCILQILLCYGMMLGFNLILNSLLMLLLPDSNPNNAALTDMAVSEYGKTAALAIFLAPLVEEPVFRGAVFGGLRRRSRILAYLVSMLLFSLYHVWAYALIDPVYLLFLLQYLPVSYLLCRCYERCNSIWGSVFLHMFINAVSLRVLTTLSEFL